jgi:hypothetical protein
VVLNGPGGCHGWAEAPNDGLREEVALDWVMKTWAEAEWVQSPSRQSVARASPSSSAAYHRGQPSIAMTRLPGKTTTTT